MISRNISFIVGQHHPELDQAIWHHRGRNGFVLGGGVMMFPAASTRAVVFRFVTFDVFVIFVDSAMNSKLLCSLTGNNRE